MVINDLDDLGLPWYPHDFGNLHMLLVNGKHVMQGPPQVDLMVQFMEKRLQEEEMRKLGSSTVSIYIYVYIYIDITHTYIYIDV
jgi:hypothetical protein